MEEAVFDEKEVLTLLEKAIDQGDLRAAIAYANWYMFGPNSERDEKKAVDLLFIAAKGNFPEALFNLGVAHERGKGVRKDARAAYLFYLRAALAGDREAFYEVGRCYCYGIGVDVDEEKSLIWLEKARDIGVNSSGKFLEEGGGGSSRASHSRRLR